MAAMAAPEPSSAKLHRGRAHAAADRCVAESKSGRPRRSGWGGGRVVAQQRGPVVVIVRGPASRINQAPKTRSSPPVPILHDHKRQQQTTATAPPPPQHFRPRATVAQVSPFPPPPPSRDQKGSDVTSPFRGRRHTPATASVEEGRPQLGACGGRSSLLDRLGPTSRGGR
ncbi:hypothetical protein HPB50_027426 [Hyalomma asiaticum]|uniref:Uncharacterized protein n=1 Tax=Hyalomma asiaticum TaxID=266040 RepID=A0ACB7SJG1_HYAAI|nr:hypothetical protein HPB50_027426 [Hyalomma asiaticum]